MKNFVIFAAGVAFVNAVIAIASAVPIFVEDEEGQQYSRTPVISRQRRDTALEGLSGGEGANSHQIGVASYKDRNDSGGSLVYGQYVKITSSVPLWSNGPTALNAEGRLGKQYGGCIIGVNHRWCKNPIQRIYY